MEVEGLAQFKILKAQYRYEALTKTIRDYDNGLDSFRRSAMFAMSGM